MGIVLGPNQYGKAENRVVRVYRDTPRHEIRDLNVSTALRGDFAAAHLTGDQARVLPTDTQKNTVYAFAKENGIGAIEDFALPLARHFVDDIEPVAGRPGRGRRVRLGPDRASTAAEHDHSFVRTRPGDPHHRGDRRRRRGHGVVVSGFKDLVVLKSTGSEFHGFLEDRYTTLPADHDRILATSLVARWRYVGTDVDWDATYAAIRQILLERVRRRAQPGAAADAVRDGPRGARAPRRGRRDPVLGAQQAPLPGTT